MIHFASFSKYLRDFFLYLFFVCLLYYFARPFSLLIARFIGRNHTTKDIIIIPLPNHCTIHFMSVVCLFAFTSVIRSYVSINLYLDFFPTIFKTATCAFAYDSAQVQGCVCLFFFHFKLLIYDAVFASHYFHIELLVQLLVDIQVFFYCLPSLHGKQHGEIRILVVTHYSTKAS